MKAFEPFKKYDYEYPEEMEKILKYLLEHGKVNVSGKTIEEFADYLSKISV